jgi:hypothetical protein
MQYTVGKNQLSSVTFPLFGAHVRTMRISKEQERDIPLSFGTESQVYLVGDLRASPGWIPFLHFLDRTDQLRCRRVQGVHAFEFSSRNGATKVPAAVFTEA